NDDIGPRAQICLEFGRQLEKESGLPVHMQDERMTTVESEDILLQADVSRKKRKKVIDQMAAVAILQRWLDSGRRG
ncbi:MAG: Holliday junction resolvase RuvX, partial [Erysipelotrichaceae bacterium]|nr:Holliday junction resolvase RuvX [Erysipelotrichaceae bacterium]